MRHLRRHVAVALVTVGLALSLTAGPAAADIGPRQTNYVAALLYSVIRADASPPGANDWSCRPSARHPHPVVLVHGTAENRYTTWSELAPRLAHDGYCVFALNDSDLKATPFHGMGDIMESASQLRHLNRGDDTVPGVRYTTIVTKYDEVVVPYTNGFLRDGGVRNITLQDVCADDHADHLGVPYDPIAIRLVRYALDPGQAKRPACQFVPPVVS